MKSFITILFQLLISASVFASNFPATMGELYCIKQGHKEEACLNVSMENAYCLNKHSALECRELKGPELCRRTTRSVDQCASKNKITGFCYLAGYTDSECEGVTAAKLICKSLGRTFEECKDITDAEVMCLRFGMTLSDCSGVTPDQVLCLEKRKDLSFCRGSGK
ncbi:hypothetical protein ACLVWU_02315 [Bdellovibrio sp. HCB290]|uniref:hypothetical protein n=1 Tax=Bdellovibrio sp. HCB290 TaxID=3394356 RepID=UPI0039B39935